MLLLCPEKAIMSSLQAFEQGKNKIRQARNFKGWIIEDPRWLIEASQVLEPNKPWTEEGPFADGISLATWKRFLQREAIRPEAFKAFCQVLGLNWQEICETDEECDRANVIDRFDLPREPQESRCYQTILQPGSFLRIKAPQYMGKTRMLNRVLERVRKNQNDARIVVLNFQNKLDSTVFNSLEQFLQAFCVCISDHLKLPDNLARYWNEKNGTPNHKTTVYFETHLLTQIDSFLILVLENIDRVFEHPLATDFCDLLRGWHGEAQRDELWQKLRLVIVHSTDVYASLDINSSPLANVGETVTLDEFTPQQVKNLVRQYELDWNSDAIEQLIALVGGHPYLINHALKTIVYQPITLEEVLAKAATEEGIYRNHLRRLWGIIQQQPTLKEALKKVVTKSQSVRIDPFQLYSLGLVKIEDNNAIPRCNLYRQYFSTLFTEGEN
jgi:AAA-like domain